MNSISKLNAKHGTGALIHWGGLGFKETKYKYVASSSAHYKYNSIGSGKPAADR